MIWEATIDTCLSHGIVTIEIEADSLEEANKKAIQMVEERYLEEYTYSRKQARQYRAKYQTLKRCNGLKS